jgi:SAM-dependent methyltransferase
MLAPPFSGGAFDLVRAVNAVNHLHDLVTGVRSLSSLLRAGGRIAGRTASRAARTTYIMSIRGTFRVSHVRIRLRCVAVTQFSS